MSNKKQIFLVYACDEWKTRKEMTLILATTSAKRARDFIADQIRRGDMEYISDDSCESAEKAFLKDWEKCPRNQINSNLEFGFVDYVYDGEEI